MENDLNYLVNNSEPFYEVQKVFMKTRSIRRNISKFQNKNISEYLLSVKALRLNEPGQTLVRKQPEKCATESLTFLLKTIINSKARYRISKI